MTSRAALIEFALRTARELCRPRAREGLEARPNGQANLMAGAAGVAVYLAEVHRVLLDVPRALAAVPLRRNKLTPLRANRNGDAIHRPAVAR